MRLPTDDLERLAVAISESRRLRADAERFLAEARTQQATADQSLTDLVLLTLRSPERPEPLADRTSASRRKLPG